MRFKKRVLEGVKAALPCVMFLTETRRRKIAALTRTLGDVVNLARDPSIAKAPANDTTTLRDAIHVILGWRHDDSNSCRRISIVS